MLKTKLLSGWKDKEEKLQFLKICSAWQLGFAIPGPGIPDDFRGNLNPGN